MRVRPLLLLCLAGGGWAFSFGVGSQDTSHWLHHHQASDTVIGLNHACYYLGVALGSLIVPATLRYYGPMCSVWGMLVAAVSLAAFPLVGGPAGWFALRLVNGIAGALSLVPLETLISRESPAAHRTRNFSFYAVALTIGGALGISLGLHLYEPGAAWPFYVGAAGPLAGAALAWRDLSLLPRRRGDEGPSLPLDLGRNYLSYATAWCQGFLEGGMLAFLSLYLLTLGLSADAAGGLMGVTTIGVILFQIPVAWLANRWGKLAVLLACYGLVAAGLGVIPLCGPTWMLALALFTFGASSGALYPLGLSLLGEQSGESALARSYACFLAMEGLGSQLGAVAMGKARDLWGEAAMFGVGLVAVGTVLVSWRLVQWRLGGRVVVVSSEVEVRRAA